MTDGAIAARSSERGRFCRDRYSYPSPTHVERVYVLATNVGELRMADNTLALFIVLTNQTSQPLTLISSQVIGSSSESELNLPQQLGRGTAGGYGCEASTTPYQAIWTYSPDGGQTLLNFDTSLNGPRGITITPTISGPQANDWLLGEVPRKEPDAWIIQYVYQPK